jgi:hypothetical protein
MVGKLPNEIIMMEAQREHRLHHYLWHEVRNSWLSYDKEETREALRNLGWEPPRPSRDKNGNRIEDNNSGEDFLFMHRQMIVQVNKKLSELKDPLYPKVEGWKGVPPPDDKNYPVPPTWDTGDSRLNDLLKEWKSDNYYTNELKQWENQYTDQNYLSQISLGQFGSRLEYTIHNRMHMRWASKPKEERPDVDPAQPDSIHIRWDDPAYDYLGDTYSSHVNSIFWMLHGWIDERIEDWKNAHQITGPIQWNGTWVGKMPHHPMTDSLHAMLSIREEDLHEENHMDNMLKALNVILDANKFYKFYS